MNTFVFINDQGAEKLVKFHWRPTIGELRFNSACFSWAATVGAAVFELGCFCCQQLPTYSAHSCSLHGPDLLVDSRQALLCSYFLPAGVSLKFEAHTKSAYRQSFWPPPQVGNRVNAQLNCTL